MKITSWFETFSAGDQMRFKLQPQRIYWAQRRCPRHGPNSLLVGSGPTPQAAILGIRSHTQKSHGPRRRESFK